MMRDTPELFLISVAAEMLDMHPQTLRKYERLGLVRPMRTLGSMRVYTRDELDRLRLIKTFVDDAGINLAGVLRPLVGTRVARRASQQRLAAEIDELFRLLGLEETR
jgi:MerR family transcriptional regulator/heat shock protein HspR